MVSTTAARSLMATNINDNSTGDVTPADIRGVFTATFDALDTTVTGVGQIAGEITSPGNRTYTLDLSAPFPYTINSLVTQTAAGAATVAVQINGTNVTGLASVSVGTTLTTTNATAANTVAANAKVTLVVSNVSGTSELSFALRYTRT